MEARLKGNLLRTNKERVQVAQSKLPIFFYQAQGEHITINSLLGLRLYLKLTPTQIYDLT